MSFYEFSCVYWDDSAAWTSLGIFYRHELFLQCAWLCVSLDAATSQSLSHIQCIYAMQHCYAVWCAHLNENSWKTSCCTCYKKKASYRHETWKENKNYDHSNDRSFSYLMWTLRYPAFLKDFSQISQVCGVSLECICLWYLKLLEWLNDFPQMQQTKGHSPLWIRIWAFNPPVCLNDLGQTVQWCGLSPKTTNMYSNHVNYT